MHVSLVDSSDNYWKLLGNLEEKSKNIFVCTLDEVKAKQLTEVQIKGQKLPKRFFNNRLFSEKNLPGA